MPVYKDEKRKTYYVKYSTKDSVTGKRKQVLKRGFATKREAVKWEAEEKADSFSAKTDITFKAMSEKYFDYRNSKESTRVNQKRMLEIHFPYYEYQMSKISKAMLMEWYLNISSKGYKPGTVNLALAVVKGIFKFASDFYNLPNTAQGLKRIKTNSIKDYQTWTPEEFNKFINIIDKQYYRACFMFIYWTGCRKSEALSLLKKDFKGNQVHIHRSIKNESSDRVLTLAPQLVDVLQPVLDRCKSPDDTVFPISKVSLHEHFIKYTKQANVKQIRIHDLRHSFATNAINNGANIVAVSKYLGHADINQTLKTYTHLLKSTDEKLVSMINEMMKI